MSRGVEASTKKRGEGEFNTGEKLIMEGDCRYRKRNFLKKGLSRV